MEFRPAKYFNRGDNAASNFARFYFTYIICMESAMSWRCVNLKVILSLNLLERQYELRTVVVRKWKD